ncbi:MAG: TonB-dependent receptor [Planctomycetes bacterium]|nr:TonB-dependent receptor [Planctomycetota bacterium]
MNERTLDPTPESISHRVSARVVACALLAAAGAAQEPAAPKPATAPQGETPPTYTIPDVVITERDSSAVPTVTPITNTAARDVIPPREVLEAGTRNVQEILRRSPGVHISEETGSDSLPNIAIRGVTGNDGIFRSVNVAMFADGIPLAGGPYGAPGASGFPLLMERVYAIDVQRGGAATQYGPNNVSGIVNFLTRPIPDRPTLETRFSYDTFRDASAYVATGGTYDAFGYLFEGVYKDGETYRDHGDHTLQNYSLKTSYAFSDTVRALLQLESFDDDSDLSDGLSLAQYQSNPWQSTSLQNRFVASQRRVNLKLEAQVATRTRLDLITYYYETERTFFLGTPLFYVDSPTYVQTTPRPMSVWAVQPQIAHEWELGGARSTLLAGVRYEHEDLTRQVDRDFPDGSQTLISKDEYAYQAGSAFVQNEIVAGDWTLTPGLRFERVDIEADNLAGLDVGRGFTEVLPALSASYLAGPNWSIYSNVQSSFQPPAANQIELSTDPQTVDAQYAWMYEVGTRVQRDDGLLAADLTVYQIDYSDRLEPDPDQFDVLLNSGRSRHRGVELALDSDLTEAGLDGFSLWSAAAYNESEYRNGDFEGNETPGSPHVLLAWGARWQDERSGLFASVDGLYTGDSYSDRENTTDINANGTRGVRPSSIVWNAHAGIERDVSADCRLRFQVDARNVFDQDYFDVRSARGLYPGAPFGLGATIGLTYGF